MASIGSSASLSMSLKLCSKLEGVEGRVGKLCSKLEGVDGRGGEGVSLWPGDRAPRHRQSVSTLLQTGRSGAVPSFSKAEGVATHWTGDP